MKIADAKAYARECDEDWSALTVAEKLNRIDSDEGHEIYSRYFGEYNTGTPTWEISIWRTWLNWGIGFNVIREVWTPEKLHICVELGPFGLYVTREWNGTVQKW